MSPLMCKHYQQQNFNITYFENSEYSYLFTAVTFNKVGIENTYIWPRGTLFHAYDWTDLTKPKSYDI